MTNDTVIRRNKDVNLENKKGNIKELKKTGHTIESNKHNIKTPNQNGNIGLQFITLGFFCVVIGIILFGFPGLQRYDDVYTIGNNIKQWLHDVDVYFHIVSDNRPGELDEDALLDKDTPAKDPSENEKRDYANGDVSNESSLRMNDQGDGTSDSVVEVTEEMIEELVEQRYQDEEEDVDEGEYPSDNEDVQDDVFLEDDNTTTSCSDVSDGETETPKKVNILNRSDARPVKTVISGNYTLPGISADNYAEPETSDFETFESQWTASGPSILAEEVEQSDESDLEDEEESGVTDDSENDSEASTEDDSNRQKLYSRANITNKSDWMIKDELDDADNALNEGKYNEAFEKYTILLRTNAQSCRAKYGIGATLDKKAECQKSNAVLNEAIQSYTEAMNCDEIPDTLFKLIGERLINRIRFKGAYAKCIGRWCINKCGLINRGRLKPAKDVLEKILSRWPDSGVAQVHYGFVLKMETNYTVATEYFAKGLQSNEPGTQDARFYFHFGDALYRLGRKAEAAQVYENGADKNLFRSKYQRSFYNVDHLTGRPWWTLEQTTYEDFFKTLEQNWKRIRDEAVNVLNQRKSLFSEETELLRDTGDWRQFELYHSGIMKPDCDKVPFTCRLVSTFSPAVTCRQGQIKFSLMDANTHVWPHCGPTNARLRAHLGLVVPSNVYIRVAEETRQWEEGKVLIFDDSFEHEVWHNGTSMRLVLIVDVWHPELTSAEKKTLPTI